MAYSNSDLNTCRTLLALSQIGGLGGQKVLRLSLSSFFLDDSNRLGLSKRLSRPLNSQEQDIYDDLSKQRLIPKSAWHWADQQIQKHHEINAQIVSFFDQAYPQVLRLIPNPPPVLFILGDCKELTQPLITVVGTRHPSPNGIQRALACSRIIIEKNFNIVSGLALGVDTLAHRVALEKQSKTFALLAHGLDRIYPEENSELSQRILDLGGALISESPIGLSVNAARLVSRNRLQSGLATATFIVETTPQGGSMHTGRAALSQRRSLWLPQSLKVQLSEFKQDRPMTKRISWLASTEHLNQVLNQAHTDFLDLQKRGVDLWQAIQKAQQRRKYTQLSLF